MKLCYWDYGYSERPHGLNQKSIMTWASIIKGNNNKMLKGKNIKK